MKILFVTPMHARFHAGGLAESCERITSGLAELGHDVVVAVFDAAHQKRVEGEGARGGRTTLEYFPPGDSVTGARPILSEQAAFDLQQAYLRIGLLVDRHRPDVIVSFFPLPLGLPASIVSQQRGIPLVLAFRGNDIGFFAHDPASLPLLQQILRNAAACTFNASDLGELAAAIAPRMPVSRVIYNGIDATVRQRAWRAIAERDPVFGSIGIFKPKKGIEVFLRAVEQLSLNERALLVGDFVKSSTRRNTFNVKVTGIVSRAEVLERLQDIDVFVAPSTSDGCPNAVLDAMAASRTIVCTPVGAMRDLLKDGESALFVRDWTDEAMCNALRAVDADAGLRRHLAEGARCVSEALTVEREMSGWEELMREAARA